MGSVCCVAAKERNIPIVTGGVAQHRTSACSPSWSFRRDNRRRVADEVEGSPYHFSEARSRNISIDKMSIDSGGRTLSEGGSPIGNIGTPASQKPAPQGEAVKNLMIAPPSDISSASRCSNEVKNLAGSPEIAPTTIPKPSLAIPSSLPTPVRDPSFTHSHLLPPRTTPSRRARRSPGHQLFRQVSDSQILGLNSPNNYSASEGRSSFVLSTCSNDFAIGSNCGSSDGGWSMNTFSELVASSQRERWSFDSEHFGSGRLKINGCSSRFSYSPSERQTCGACSKLLTDRSSFSSQRIIANFELPVIAVLDCRHVYHSECLEAMTPDTDKYDPVCPVCTVGEKQVMKMSRKALKAEADLRAKHYKRCKNRVVDSNLDGDCNEFGHGKGENREGKALKMDPGSSARSSSSKPFLKRHLSSFGSKWSKSLSRDSGLKKGFWSRSRKDEAI